MGQGGVYSKARTSTIEIVTAGYIQQYKEKLSLNLYCDTLQLPFEGLISLSPEELDVVNIYAQRETFVGLVCPTLTSVYIPMSFIKYFI